MTPIEWLKMHGGTGVFVKTKRNDELEWKGGGRVFIACGEVAPFSPATILKLVNDGKATRDGARVTLKGGEA